MNFNWDNLKKINKKHWGLIALGLLGVAMLVFSPSDDSGVDKTKKNVEPKKANTTGEINTQIAKKEKALAYKLENMISTIKGAGEVKVSVRIAKSKCSQYALDKDSNKKVTREEDQSGGTRTTTETRKNEKIVVVQGNEGGEKPLIEKETTPEIDGVLVIADGASRPEIKSRIFNAVKVALGVEPHKVMVFAMERNEG
ncbi:MAG: hypothetical protein K9L17_00515 [Clostridiales bacterium]|nr:hypothetical protein [Clostridiales bacterium]MCF8021174.1 hypothetical protein [Clostridiales bacterium]